MVKFDENDLVEYNIFSTVTSGLGGFATLLSFLFYAGMFIVFAMAAGAMLLGVLGIL